MLLAMASGFIAAKAKEPLLALDDEEAAKVSVAAANVAKHYDIPVSPLAQAWMGLGMTLGSIYAAKIAALKLMKSMEKTS